MLFGLKCFFPLSVPQRLARTLMFLDDICREGDSDGSFLTVLEDLARSLAQFRYRKATHPDAL